MTWYQLIWRKFREGELTPTHRDVLLRLGEYRDGATGEAWPSHVTLAQRTRCSVSALPFTKSRRSIGKWAGLTIYCRNCLLSLSGNA